MSPASLEIELREKWERILKKSGMPANIHQQGRHPRLTNNRRTRVVPYYEGMVGPRNRAGRALAPWPEQGTSVDQAGDLRPVETILYPN